MSLDGFLRGTRPNPDETPPGGDGARLLHRHAEGGEWTLVAETDTSAGMKDEWQSGTRHWPTDATPGDLARMDITDPQGHWFPVVMFGVRRDGQLAPLPTPDPRWIPSVGRFWFARLGDERAGFLDVWERCPSAEWLVDILFRGRLPRPQLVGALLYLESAFKAFIRGRKTRVIHAARLYDAQVLTLLRGLRAWSQSPTEEARGRIEASLQLLGPFAVGRPVTEAEDDLADASMAEAVVYAAACGLAPNDVEAREAARLSLARTASFVVDRWPATPFSFAEHQAALFRGALPFDQVVLAFLDPEQAA